MTKLILKEKQDEDVEQQKQLLTKTVMHVLELAKQKGASACEVSVSHDQGFSINVRLGEVQTLEYQRDKGLGITVYFGQQKASVSTSDTSLEAITSTIEKACTIAKNTGSDPYAGLADAELMAYDYPDLDLCHPWDVLPEQAIAFAKQCEALGLSTDKRIQNSEGCEVSSHTGLVVYGNSHGFISGFPWSSHQFSLSLIATEHEKMQRDYAYTVSRLPNLLSSKETIAAEAAKKVLSRLNARKIATQTAPVIFHADVARSLLSSFCAAIGGTSQYRKASFLLDQCGKKVLPSFINLVEKPFIKQGLYSAPFDGEGVKKQERTFVENGILQSYILSSYSARKLGLKTTGNSGGVNNLQITTSSQDLSQLIKHMHKGLIVTELLGQGINLVTGDYSRGAAGFWVENGEIQYPVEEITIAGNLKTMLENIVTIANDVDYRSTLQTGSILIDSMMIAGD